MVEVRAAGRFGGVKLAGAVHAEPAPGFRAAKRIKRERQGAVVALELGREPAHSPVPDRALELQHIDPGQATFGASPGTLDDGGRVVRRGKLRPCPGMVLLWGRYEN